MNYNGAAFTQSLSYYLQASVKLEALEKMTADLDKELADSQKLMHEVHTIYNSIPNAQQRRLQENANSRTENVTQFLDSNTPVLRLPEMPETTEDVNIDNIVATMKSYAEGLRQNLSTCKTENNFSKRNIEKVDFSYYSLSLQQLNKNLSIKTHANGHHGDTQLEENLARLISNVNMFTQMVESNSKIREANETLTDSQPEITFVQYDTIVMNILSVINEVTYLLKK